MMHATKTTLRVLIVAQFLIGVGSMLVAEFGMPASTAALSDRAEPFEYGLSPAFAKMMLACFIVTAIGALVSWIGLFLFWRPARPLFLITATLLLLPTLLGGPHVHDGMSATLAQVVSIITGVILGLIYFSPLKHLYERNEVRTLNGPAAHRRPAEQAGGSANLSPPVAVVRGPSGRKH